MRTCRILGDLTRMRGHRARGRRRPRQSSAPSTSWCTTPAATSPRPAASPTPTMRVTSRRRTCAPSSTATCCAPSSCASGWRRGMMERRRGRIVTISSIAAFQGPHPRASIYATAKAGVVHYTRCLADQLRPYDVTVNTLAPGDTRTGPLPRHPRRSDPERLAEARHARPRRHGRRGGARGRVLRRAARRLRLRSGAAGRWRQPVLAGLNLHRGHDRQRAHAVPPTWLTASGLSERPPRGRPLSRGR